MKVYTENYTLPREIDTLLYEASREMDLGFYCEAAENISKARESLKEYLAKNNKGEDCIDERYGFVKEVDTFDHDQLCFIRDEFACIMERTKNANDELDIINKCCRLLDDPEYESYEEFTKDTSGSWAEKYIPEEEEQ